MLNHSKTFRLFISSTFSDFEKEREVLQVKVFPKIQEYCSLNGYTFQPIDLRWGVSNEAQLDQKTLEICLNEVQSCKRHDYPNFLIMLGDRYGWIPLPNTIKKDEFEILLENITDIDKKHLTHWYIEDKNQLPVSYILKQREDKYIDDSIWEVVENKIRHILQEAASKADLNDNIKDKYFISATETEAIEGIIPYFTTTEYQQKLLQLIPNLEQTDPTHIFGFFRHINNTITDDKFVSTDYKKAKKFKEKIKKILPDVNTLNIHTSQINENKLDESYLDQFETSIIEFLKYQIDKQISEDNKSNYSNLEIEKFQQEYFLNKKIKNFLGQEKVLTEIQNYIDNDMSHPLIICGKSGIGKSSIIAKAIENTFNETNKRIIYRFIGVTPHLTTTKEILTSILEELGTVKDDKKSINNKEEDNFVNFSDKMYEQIMNLEENVVIFIDAVDQLTNDDQFLWLPNKLPSNVKIIISTLKDKEYEDSKYFYTLEDKVSNYIEIEPFNKPIELLELLLSHKKRTLQHEQKEYFLTQYGKVKTPLYVYIASTQIQYWRSNDVVEKNIFLSFTQKDMVKDFIENLSLTHHHNKRLVQKIFSYIVSSKDGLSEYEILELLNTDKDFIKDLAPDTWHTNITQTLPLVIWTRLYNHIKSFLSQKNQDGQELLYFFHREFVDVVIKEANQKDEHENIIEATQKLIIKHQDKEFNSNRWGKVYVLLLTNYYSKYGDETKVLQYYNNILLAIESSLVLDYLDYIGLKRDEYMLNKNNYMSEHLIQVLIFVSNKYKEVSDKFYLKYLGNLHFQATILISNTEYLNAIDIEEKNIKDIEALTIFDQIKNIKNTKNIDFKKNNLDTELKWLYLYLQVRLYLGFSYLQNKDKVHSLQFNQENYLLFKNIYENNPKNKLLEIIYYDQTNYYAMTLQHNGVFFQAIDLLKESLDVLEKEYNEEHIYLYGNYAKLLHVLSGITYSIKEFNDSKKYFSKAYEVYEKLLKYDFNTYSKTITSLNNYLIENFNANNLFMQSEHYYKYNIKLLNRQGKKGVDEKIKTISDDLFIKITNLKKKNKQIELFFVNKRLIEYVFNFDKDYWAKTYVQRLIDLGGLLNESKIDDAKLSFAENLQKEGVDICEKYMNEEDDWYDLYTKNMNNLANTYLYLNKKEESFLLNKKNLDISSKLFQSNQEKWFRAYYYALTNMAGTYFFNGDEDKEKKCRDKIKELESNPLFQTIPDVMKNKATDTKINYFDYAYKTLLLVGAYFFIKYVFLE